MAFDMSELQGLLAQFAPTEEEKRQAKLQSIANFGFGLMGARKGEEWDRVGRSGAYALQNQGDVLHNITQSKMQGMQAAGQAMGLQEQLQKFKDADAARQAAQEYALQRQAPAGNTPGAPAQQAPTDLYQQLLKKADFYESKGLVQQADAIREAAQKFAPKYKGTETVMKDGKPVILQQYENQAPTEMTGYAPKPDYKQVDTGDKVGFYDPLTGKGGGSFGKANSPDALLSSDTARRGQNMTDARSREMHQLAAAQAGKPQIVTGPDGQIYAVDPRSAQGTEVMGSDGKPLNKGAKLTETQSNATAFGMRMAAANGIVNKLEDSGYNVASPKNLLAANPVTNYAASPEAQALHQAKLNFMTASLRKESGAAISKSEFETEDKKYFPQPGDRPSVIEQKRQMRELALKAMATQAGPGGSHFAQPSIDDLVKKYAR